MSVDAFLDTNVLVYAANHDARFQNNRRRALELIEEVDFGLSTQVLQEFYVTVVRKIRTPLTATEALEWMEQFQAFPCLAIDSSLVKIAAEKSVRYRISYWDAAIVAASEALGASILYSEDLADGQRYGSVRVENPFRE